MKILPLILFLISQKMLSSKVSIAMEFIAMATPPCIQMILSFASQAVLPHGCMKQSAVLQLLASS